MWKKYSLLILALAMILSLALTGCGKDQPDATEPANPSESLTDATNSESPAEENDPALKTVAEKFAIAALSGDKDGIAACTHEKMQEVFEKTYGEAEFVFTNVKAEANDEIVIYSDGLELYTSDIAREYGIKANMAAASSFTVNFTADYNGKNYSGSMTVMVATFDEGNYVIQAQIDRMEDAFYEDNCPEGDFYFDMHGEE